MSDTDPTTDASLANAQQNAAAYPATSGDVDRSTGLPADQSPVTASVDTLTVDSTVDDVVTYLTAADIDDTERARRADFAEQVEAQRDGEARKGVTTAIEQARQPS